MNGGSGHNHDTGAHSTSGNINDGPTGLGVGGGASSGSGWSPKNDSWGDGSGSGIHWDGGSGHDNGRGNGNSDGGLGTDGNLLAIATPVTFGFLAPSVLGAGGLAVSILAGALSAVITDIMAALKGPFKFGPWGATLHGILPL